MVKSRIVFLLLAITFYLVTASTASATWGWDIHTLDSTGVVGQHTDIDLDATYSSIIDPYKIFEHIKNEHITNSGSIASSIKVIDDFI